MKLHPYSFPKKIEDNTIISKYYLQNSKKFCFRSNFVKNQFFPIWVFVTEKSHSCCAPVMGITGIYGVNLMKS